MGEEKSRSDDQDDRDGLAEVLRQIDTPEPLVRFVQGWDPDEQRLWFGCGGREVGVLLGSDRTSDTVTDGVYPTKLQPHVVERYLSRGRSPSGPHLVRRYKKLLQKYLYFEDPRLYTLVALWIVGTYVYSIFGHYGYLFVFSMLMRSGKTRVGELLSHLAFEASPPLNAPTPAALRELASEGGTSVLDTLERWGEKSPESFGAAMDILDAGFRNGGTVTKMVPAGDGEWRREEYPVYAPFMMAAIGRDSLTDTARDRSFVVEMHRKPSDMKKAKYNWHLCEKECQPVRDDTYMWALRNAERVSSTYLNKQLEQNIDDLGLTDRAADIWCPLFALASVLGIPASEVEQVKTLAREMGGDTETVADAERLSVIQALRGMANRGQVVGTTTDLAEGLRDVGVVGVNVQEHLTEWGFLQKSVRLPARGPRRAWELDDRRLAKIERELADSLPKGATPSPCPRVTTVTTPHPAMPAPEGV